VDYFFGDPDVIEKRKEDIEDAILISLEQRGIRPAKGQYYSIEAVVEESLSSVQKVKMANGDELPAPVLMCRMRIRDSVGRGNYIYGESRTIELPADMLAKASKSKFRTFSELGPIKETLWKDVTREFKALTDQFKPEGAAAPAAADAPAKTAAPTETAAPAK